MPYDPAIPLLRINLKVPIKYLFITALFTIVKLWKQPRCATTDEQIKKMWYLYIMEFYSDTKKRNEILSFVGKWMESESINFPSLSFIEMVRGTFWHFCRFLQCTKISCMISSPQLFSFFRPPLIPEVVSTGIVFAFTYRCTHFLHDILSSILFLNTCPLILVSALPLGKTCSALLFSNF
jgi:hypothetical protein